MPRDIEIQQEFERIRIKAYPSIGDQLDMIYWDKKNNTKKWEEVINKVKADHPKTNISDGGK